jgi:uncharacterized membrane protein YqjE
MTGPTNLIGRVADLAADLLGMLQTRLELLGVELQRERNAILLQLKLVMTAVVAAGVAALSAVLWAALSLAPPARSVALGLLTITFVAVAVACLGVARSQRRRQGEMFNSVIAQLGRDRLTLSAQPDGIEQESVNETAGDARQGT